MSVPVRWVSADDPPSDAPRWADAGDPHAAATRWWAAFDLDRPYGESTVTLGGSWGDGPGV